MKKNGVIGAWTRVAMVVALLSVCVSTMAQSTWKQLEKKHVVSKQTEENMGGVIVCELPEKTVKGNITVGLATTGQEDMLAEVFEGGDAPKLYAAIFFQEPKEKGEQLYQKVKAGGDRQLIRTSDKQRWVTPLDATSKRELTYTFTTADHAQAEFWLVTAIAYGDGKGAAWDVLHYMRGSSKKNTEGYPLFDDPEWYSYEVKWKHNNSRETLPRPKGSEDDDSFEDDYYENLQKDYTIQTFSHHKGYPKTLLQEDHYVISISNIPVFSKMATDNARGLFYEYENPRESLGNLSNCRMSIRCIEEELPFISVHIPDAIRLGGGVTNSVFIEPLKSMSQMKNYWIPAYKKSEEDNNKNYQVEVRTEEKTFCGHPALFIFSTKTYIKEDIKSIDTEVGIVIFTEVPLRANLSDVRSCIEYVGGTIPDNIEEKIGSSFFIIPMGASCSSYGCGEFFDQTDENYQIAYQKLLEGLDIVNKTVKIKVDHQRTVLVDDYYVVEGSVPETPKDSISLDSLENIHIEELSEREKIEWIEKLWGWFTGGNDILGEHTSGAESAVISVLGLLLASLLGSSGGGGLPLGGGGDGGSVPPSPPSDPETERLKELDRQQGQQWADEQRKQNQAQWDREREIGEQKARQREAEQRAAEQAAKRKAELMKKLSKEFNTTDKETIKKELEKRKKDLQDQANKDQLTATLWNIATWGTWGVEKACDITINVMGECVPGGKAVKNGYTLLKAPLKRFAEVKEANTRGAGESVKTALLQGTIEGLIGVVQNEAGAFSKSLGGWGEMTAVVGGESTKAALAAYIQGDDMGDIASAATKAGIQKSIYYGIGKGMGAVGKARKEVKTAPLIKRMNDLQIKKLDLLKAGNVKEAIAVTKERWGVINAIRAVSSKANAYTTQASSLSQEAGAELVTNPLVDHIMDN